MYIIVENICRNTVSCCFSLLAQIKLYFIYVKIQLWKEQIFSKRRIFALLSYVVILFPPWLLWILNVISYIDASPSQNRDTTVLHEKKKERSPTPRSSKATAVTHFYLGILQLLSGNYLPGPRANYRWLSTCFSSTSRFTAGRSGFHTHSNKFTRNSISNHGAEDGILLPILTLSRVNTCFSNLKSPFI